MSRSRADQTTGVSQVCYYPSFGGQSLHSDLFEMAAAYAFHLCQNHPFIDGNKRVALASALVFLDLNGVQLSDPEGKLYALMMAVARGEKRKPEIAQTLRELSPKQ